MSALSVASRRWRSSHHRRGGHGSGFDWELVGGAVIAVVAIGAILLLVFLNADPVPDTVPMTTP